MWFNFNHNLKVVVFNDCVQQFQPLIYLVLTVDFIDYSNLNKG